MLVLALVSLLSSPAPIVAQTFENLPQPEEGEWAPTTLALLHYNRNLCDTIAGKVRQRWRSLGDSNGKAEQTIRDFVLQSSLSDLAAARAAGDIVDLFLEQAREETSPETGASLARLADLGTTLCDFVALPTAPRESFELQIQDLMTQIDREETELGRLLVVPEEILQQALEPYLAPIQMAGVQAEGQYIDYLESLRPKPKEPTLQERMVGWYGGYQQKTAPLKGALGQFLQARQDNNAVAIRKACREMSALVIPLLRDDTLFDVPDSSLNDPLRRTYQEIRTLASHCSAARFREVDQQIQVVQRYLTFTAQILAPYGLRP